MKASFIEYLRRCAEIGADAAAIKAVAEASIKYYTGNAEERVERRPKQTQEERWYESLEKGSPDYSIYDEEIYLADMWACWSVYSRKYLLLISKHASQWMKISPRVIVDVGCGAGITTGALKQLFPPARVIGTQRPDNWQSKFALKLASQIGFEIMPKVVTKERADFLFASEYFEHFGKPVDHLNEVLDAARPKAMMVANAFGAHSIGHFDTYFSEGKTITPKVAGKLFNETLKQRGYKKVETGFWNDRPTVWTMKE